MLSGLEGASLGASAPGDAQLANDLERAWPRQVSMVRRQSLVFSSSSISRGMRCSSPAIAAAYSAALARILSRASSVDGSTRWPAAGLQQVLRLTGSQETGAAEARTLLRTAAEAETTYVCMVALSAHRVTSSQGRMVSMPAKSGTDCAAFMAAAWRLMPASSPKMRAAHSPAYSILQARTHVASCAMVSTMHCHALQADHNAELTSPHLKSSVSSLLDARARQRRGAGRTSKQAPRQRQESQMRACTGHGPGAPAARALSGLCEPAHPAPASAMAQEGSTLHTPAPQHLSRALTIRLFSCGSACTYPCM